MKPIVPGRILCGGLVVEAIPLARGLANVYRGADLGSAPEETSSVGIAASGPYRARPAVPPRARVPVIVRLVAPEIDGSDREQLFARMTRTRHLMTGTPAPRLLHTFGRGGKVLGSAEEHLSGTTLENLLHALRERGAAMPIGVALAVGQGLLPLWTTAVPAGAPASVDARGVILDARGEVRAIPSYREEQSRHVVGAALFSLRELASMTSPEEIMGQEPDSRSAMFYLGVLLYEMVAGLHPTASSNKKLFEVLTEVAQRDATHLRKHRSDVHPVVAKFVHRCLARDAGKRFASWEKLVAAYNGVRALFPPAGRAEVLAHHREIVPGHPLGSPPPVEVPDDWRTRLPDFGYEPVPLIGPAPTGERLGPVARKARAALDPGAVYPRADGRPMYSVSGTLLVDARPVSRAEIERYLLARRMVVPAHLAPLDTATADEPCALVSAEMAAAYGAWAGKRLPTDAEWEAAVAALGADRLGVGNLWEWTSTPHENGGQVVRGGRWRDQFTMPWHPGNRSFATSPAPDLGFRCVTDVVAS